MRVNLISHCCLHVCMVKRVNLISFDRFTLLPETQYLGPGVAAGMS